MVGVGMAVTAEAIEADMAGVGTAVMAEAIEADMAGVGAAVTAEATVAGMEVGAAAGAAVMAVGVGADWDLDCISRLYRFITTRCGQTECLTIMPTAITLNWDGDVGQYETVNPPPEVQQQAAALSPNLIAYPKNGQTEAQQATDKSACRTWAAAQSGFDPTRAAATQGATTDSTTKRTDYMRAQAACLEGRGYSVE